jgi:hypothetical protein
MMMMGLKFELSLKFERYIYIYIYIYIHMRGDQRPLFLATWVEFSDCT